MLKKENRLVRKKEFDGVFKGGVSSYNKTLGIKALKSDGGMKVGVIVSSKVSKKAIERNRIKRQIRSIIKEEIKKIKQNYFYIIIALPPIINMEYIEIKESVVAQLKKLKLYNK